MAAVEIFFRKMKFFWATSVKKVIKIKILT